MRRSRSWLAALGAFGAVAAAGPGVAHATPLPGITPAINGYSADGDARVFGFGGSMTITGLYNCEALPELPVIDDGSFRQMTVTARGQWSGNGSVVSAFGSIEDDDIICDGDDHYYAVTALASGLPIQGGRVAVAHTFDVCDRIGCTNESAGYWVSTVGDVYMPPKATSSASARAKASDARAKARARAHTVRAARKVAAGARAKARAKH